MVTSNNNWLSLAWPKTHFYMLLGAFKKQKHESTHELVYFYCLVLLAVGLPTSRFLVSVSQIIIVVNWLLEGGFKEKLERLAQNKTALALASIYLVFVLGMMHTGDLWHGLTYDLKNKLPIFSFTIVVASSKPFTDSRIKILPLLFGVSVVLVSFIGAIIFATNSFIDTRLLSPFTVHIFYGLMVLVSVFIIPWSTRQISQKKGYNYLSFVVSGWLLFFLFLLSSLTVLASLATVIIFLLMKQVFFQKNIALRIASGLLLIALAIMATAVFKTVSTPLFLKIEPTPESLSQRTILGNEYHHDQDVLFRENGHLVFWFISRQELEDAWNERSSLKFTGSDKNGNLVEYTIYRYLSSLGLKKDRSGVEALTSADVEAIEYGIANHLYVEWPNFFVRIHQSLWELQQYKLTGNPNGYSITQRIELWRASLKAIEKNKLFGWGTGDVLQALNFGLDSINSELQNRKMKPHNQFLVWLIMVGSAGTVIVLGLFGIYICKTRSYKYLPMQIMLVSLIVTMFADMPFDYQMGINLVLFTSVYFGIIFKKTNCH